MAAAASSGCDSDAEGEGAFGFEEVATVGGMGETVTEFEEVAAIGTDGMWFGAMLGVSMAFSFPLRGSLILSVAVGTGWY